MSGVCASGVCVSGMCVSGVCEWRMCEWRMREWRGYFVINRLNVTMEGLKSNNAQPQYFLIKLEKRLIL